MRALVADDEEPARRRLIRQLQTLGGVEVVGEVADGLEALAQVRSLQPEILFLDVRMPALDGIAVASRNVTLTPIVFTTAYDEFAVQAFDVEAVDYLLKPIALERLAAAVARVRLRAQAEAERITAALRGQSGRPPAGVPRVTAQSRGALHFFDAREVLPSGRKLFGEPGLPFLRDAPIETQIVAPQRQHHRAILGNGQDRIITGRLRQNPAMDLKQGGRGFIHGRLPRQATSNATRNICAVGWRKSSGFFEASAAFSRGRARRPQASKTIGPTCCRCGRFCPGPLIRGGQVQCERGMGSPEGTHRRWSSECRSESELLVRVFRGQGPRPANLSASCPDELRTLSPRTSIGRDSPGGKDGQFEVRRSAT